jgi:guanylate kinase
MRAGKLPGGGEQGAMLEEILPKQGRLLVVSGPSGVGKDTVLERLLHSSPCPPNLVRCVTATTRPPRAGETHAVDYYFFSREEFEARIAQNFFLEHASYGQHLYGTPRDFVERERARNNDVILKIEVQGALMVKRAMPDAILIFLAPPSWEELERRLRSRQTDDAAALQIRLETARRELQTAPLYDYLVVNDDLERAVETLRQIILAERCRIVHGDAHVQPPAL